MGKGTGRTESGTLRSASEMDVCLVSKEFMCQMCVN